MGNSKLLQIQEQKHKLNPQQILNANIMQLSFNILEKRITEELEKNPMLEIEEEDENQNDFENIRPLSKQYDNQEYSEIEHASVLSLFEDFNAQLVDVNATEEELNIAEHVLGNIDDDGYLSIEPILIADKLNITEDVIQKVIKKIQYLDPPGIASKNISDCLLSQLEYYYPNEILAHNILSICFSDFANHNYDKIIKKIKCNEGELKDSLSIISSLNPKPASMYSTVMNEYIQPDIILDKDKDDWTIIINNNFLPELVINKNYEKLLQDKKTKNETKIFLKQKMDTAKWFVSAIFNRYYTIKKVMETIIALQPSYFNFENRSLRPMSLKNVADKIDMDISTISRATNGKYVQLPWGCLELKTLFSESIKMKNGTDVSNTIVKKRIKDIIFSEDKKTPLNDSQIANILNQEGYIVARRTVAKYRESQRISVSRLRKKMFNNKG